MGFRETGPVKLSAALLMGRYHVSGRVLPLIPTSKTRRVHRFYCSAIVGQFVCVRRVRVGCLERAAAGGAGSRAGWVQASAATVSTTSSAL